MLQLLKLWGRFSIKYIYELWYSLYKKYDKRLLIIRKQEKCFYAL